MSQYCYVILNNAGHSWPVLSAAAAAPGAAWDQGSFVLAQLLLEGWVPVRETPMGRWGMPEEVAGGIVFLASPAARFVTGAILAIDGGYLAV